MDGWWTKEWILMYLKDGPNRWMAPMDGSLQDHVRIPPFLTLVLIYEPRDEWPHGRMNLWMTYFSDGWTNG